MAEHPDAAAFRRVFDAMNEGRSDEFVAILDDEVEWYEIGADEPVRGKEAVLERFRADTDFEIEARLHDVLATDDHVVGLVSARATRDGETLDYRTAEILHMEDGRVTSRWSYAEDPQAVLEFFGG